MSDLEKAWKYEFNAWRDRLLSRPVELLQSADYSQTYEMDRAHIFQLENGSYAFVKESGCSCYTADDADVELYPNYGGAFRAFKDWEGSRI